MELRQTKPITEIKNYYSTVLGDQVKNFLSIDNDFPRWKQLALMTLETQLMRRYTQGELTKKETGIYHKVCAINDWKTDLETQYIEITSSIHKASNVQEIRELVSSFKYLPIPYEIDLTQLRLG